MVGSAQSVQFLIFRARNGGSFPFRRNGTERKRRCFNGAYCTMLLVVSLAFSIEIYIIRHICTNNQVHYDAI